METKPSTRKEKLAILKEVEKGNFNTLNSLIEEQNKDAVTGYDILQCSYFLLEHGRPEGVSHHIKYDRCCITSIGDLGEIENAFKIKVQTGSLDTVSLSTLKKLEECIECYRALKESRQLELLKPYCLNIKQ